MTINVTQRHNESRLGGSLSDLNVGAGTPAIRVYGGTKPNTANDPPTSAMLVSIPLTKPAGTISGGQLTLTPSGAGLIANSGVPTWARAVDCNGDTCFDMDAGPVGTVENPATWELQLAYTTQLYAGGEVTLASAVLG